MIIKKDVDVPEIFVEEEGAKGVKRKILIGPEDDSLNIIMRYFKVLAGGSTPFYTEARCVKQKLIPLSRPLLQMRPHLFLPEAGLR